MYATPYPSPWQRPIQVVLAFEVERTQAQRALPVFLGERNITPVLARAGIKVYARGGTLTHLTIDEGMDSELARLARAARQLDEKAALAALAERVGQAKGLSNVASYSLQVAIADRRADVLRNRYTVSWKVYAYDGALRAEASSGPESDGAPPG